MTLDEAREVIGQRVVYSPKPGYTEEGTIVRVTESWVHVDYGLVPGHTKATHPRLLTLATDGAA